MAFLLFTYGNYEVKTLIFISIMATSIVCPCRIDPDLATNGETDMSNKLHNKVALVTGGTIGIGLATAQTLADEGAQVFITGRRQAELDAAVQAIGHGAVGIRSDASKLDELDGMYAQIKAKAGRLDVLFANAGGGDMLPLGAITEAHYEGIFGRNVK